MSITTHLAQVLVAQAATSTAASDLGGLVVDAFSAFQSKNWSVLSGVLLMLVVVIARKINVVQRIPLDYIPWATAGLALAASVGLGLVNGEPWENIVGTGINVGLSAVGAWETLGKPIAKLVAPKPGATP